MARKTKASHMTKTVNFDISETLMEDGREFSYGLCCRDITTDDTAIIIQGGQGSTIFGQGNKYMTMADNLRKKYGVAVLVVAANYDYTDLFTNELAFLYSKLPSVRKIYFMGNSKGAMLGARFAHRHREIKRMLLVNMPLMINWHQSRAGLAEFAGEKITFVFGDKDPSYGYREIVDVVPYKTKHELITIPGANHNFVGLEEEFMELPGKYLM